ncbi:hypothetical protein P152DRAFT_459675 [Eremomyces bilateralis CBS 781.70]|uniref:N-acetyltransferase domain-containing protein n=1 Tax=Eremomyces bilateralis CBS 781.70 TaxID=1392243 RepID=A0A6G1FZP9_9PEZI|nr:uncharacterized protein P152DRAFT_459675 [Eremomyces bilateralis CBS 781.70]KAF1811274.1 hypothetical protein P152DRAFT_459675 [Eremomyces bilateralis CBS 781.70]
MPAVPDDPTAPVIYRRSGEPPFPTAGSPFPIDIVSRQVTLRDRITVASIVPFSSSSEVPVSLLAYLCEELNKEIEKGDTYPMIDPMTLETFGPYWFANFGAVMLLGDVDNAADLRRMAHKGCDWHKECLGSFYIKPNYPGRSSHVCTGGFLVTDASRNRGVGRLMGEAYLEWAPKLGYTYSVFNLVYETNVASCKIWDALGFKRIGRVKGCGNLKSSPDQLVDAIIYGRDLGLEGDEFVTEERFDKIKFYLRHGKYPNGADRAEKSRLRSAATHYKLIPAIDNEPEKLMLKDKEVISDPLRQYEVARQIHLMHHGGINKSTASIADKYHWVRIKETVSLVIKNCPECKDSAAKAASKGEPIPSRKDDPSPVPRDLEERVSETPTQPEPIPTESNGFIPATQESFAMRDAQTDMHDTHDPLSHSQISFPNDEEISFSPMPEIVHYEVPLDPRLIAEMDSTFDTFDQATTHQQQEAALGHDLSGMDGLAGMPTDLSGDFNQSSTAHLSWSQQLALHNLSDPTGLVMDSTPDDTAFAEAIQNASFMTFADPDEPYDQHQIPTNHDDAAAMSQNVMVSGLHMNSHNVDDQNMSHMADQSSSHG